MGEAWREGVKPVRRVRTVRLKCNECAKRSVIVVRNVQGRYFYWCTKCDGQPWLSGTF